MQSQYKPILKPFHNKFLVYCYQLDLSHVSPKVIFILNKQLWWTPALLLLGQNLVLSFSFTSLTIFCYISCVSREEKRITTQKNYKFNHVGSSSRLAYTHTHTHTKTKWSSWRQQNCFSEGGSDCVTGILRKTRF